MWKWPNNVYFGKHFMAIVQVFDAGALKRALANLQYFVFRFFVSLYLLSFFFRKNGSIPLHRVTWFIVLVSTRILHYNLVSQCYFHVLLKKTPVNQIGVRSYLVWIQVHWTMYRSFVNSYLQIIIITSSIYLDVLFSHIPKYSDCRLLHWTIVQSRHQTSLNAGELLNC